MTSELLLLGREVGVSRWVSDPETVCSSQAPAPKIFLHMSELTSTPVTVESTLNKLLNIVDDDNIEVSYNEAIHDGLYSFSHKGSSYRIHRLPDQEEVRVIVQKGTEEMSVDVDINFAQLVQVHERQTKTDILRLIEL